MLPPPCRPPPTTPGDGAEARPRPRSSPPHAARRPLTLPLSTGPWFSCRLSGHQHYPRPKLVDHQITQQLARFRLGHPPFQQTVTAGRWRSSRVSADPIRPRDATAAAAPPRGWACAALAGPVAGRRGRGGGRRAPGQRGPATRQELRRRASRRAARPQMGCDGPRVRERLGHDKLGCRGAPEGTDQLQRQLRLLLEHLIDALKGQAGDGT